ncbi:hypothetical protein AQUCO_02300181v1 [Aquilegia coerulea]|uniref:Peroxidase n=1 Tax=Aquilegia coerulea TaxID=218851 RepID=A0A2G5DCE7_AQUCA|nr:hypothetical protein AQUCO_02300181v1 [Aquilegia coerulea]
MTSFASFFSLLLISSLLLGSHLSLTSAQTSPPLVRGLSFDFHRSTCPRLERIIRDELNNAFRRDIGLAAALLRIHFHDCFVQGCDASVLLEGSVAGPGEQEAPPNLTLRPDAIRLLNDLRERVHRACGQVVSCSDITALAARDAVVLTGGPEYRVPLGRRDGHNFATREDTINNLPSPLATARQLIDSLRTKGLDPTDIVALSGGHTIGRSLCTSFTNRLYPNQDPTMDPGYAANLKRTCPRADSNGTTMLDVQTPNMFDNRYYINLRNRQGLLTSDQDLFMDSTTRPIVTRFAENQRFFFERFAFSMIKMGMLNVTTGTQGEIRANCSRRNPPRSTYLTTMLDEEGESAAF